MTLNISGMIYCHGEEVDLISWLHHSAELNQLHCTNVVKKYELFPSNSTENILQDNYKICFRVSEVGINLQNCEMESCIFFLYSTSREI